jgi:rhamnosyltransferase
MKTICSLITVYKPDIAKLKFNIEIMLQYSGSIYLLFNSSIIPEFQFDTRIVLIDNKKNIGISRAINKGINLAVKDGYEYAILFDQDSILTRDDFEKLFSEMCYEEKTGKIACIGPSLNIRNNKIRIRNWICNKKIVQSKEVVSVNNIITSGMLINIKNFLDINGFNEDFPVDFCDFLFCWKAICNGYSVIQSKNAYINHEVGNYDVKIFGHTISIHAPYRNYFLVRDTLNVCFRVKETPLQIRFRFLIFLPIRIFLFLFLLDKKKMRLKMYWIGFIDFLLNKKHFGSIANILDAE